MRFILNFLQSYNWVLIGSALLLSIMGLLELHSIGAGEVGIESTFSTRQATFIVVGLFAMIIVGCINWRYYADSIIAPLAIYLTSLLILGGLFFFGVEINNSLSWYSFGPINFEPVELVKIMLLLFLARFFSRRYQKMFQVRHTIISLGYYMVPLALVVMQPDAGSALVLALLWVAVVLVAGMRARQIAILFLGGITSLLLVWNFALADYQKNRVLLVLNPDQDPQGTGYNLYQSLIAIGSGGLFGSGLGLGTQTQLNFLPEAQTDFIISSIGEEMGFSGISVILILYSVLLYQIFIIGIRAKHAFQKLFSFSFGLLLFGQIFINISMSLGLFPVVGIALPFVSLGGSSIVANWIGIGLLHSMRNFK